MVELFSEAVPAPQLQAATNSLRRAPASTIGNPQSISGRTECDQPSAARRIQHSRSHSVQPDILTLIASQGSHGDVGDCNGLSHLPFLTSPLIEAIRSNSEGGMGQDVRRMAYISGRRHGKEYVRGHGSFLRRTSSFGGGPLVVRTSSHPCSVPVKADVVEEAEHMRWIILLLSCFLLFGNFYAYDIPAALNIPLRQFLGVDYDSWQYELNLLYSVYSFPNMFLPFFGGQLADRFNTKTVLLVFSVTVCIGQTLFSIGVSTKCFGLMIFGRILFGIGGESIGVIQSTITTNYFKNKELALSLGLNAGTAVWVGSATCYMSLGCAIVLASIIGTQQPNSVGSSKHITESTQDITESTPLLNGSGSLDCSVGDLCPTSPPMNPLTPLPPTKSTLAQISQLFNPGFLVQLPVSFWILCSVCILLYGTVIPFNNIASDFLMSKWYPGDTEMAGMVMSIPDSMSAVLVPLLGYLVDRYGGRALMLLGCAVVIAGVHLTLGLTMTNPILPMVLLGFSYSLYGVAIWPSVATVIQHREQQMRSENPEAEPPRLLGASFGLATSALNASLTVVPLIAAQIRVQGGSYAPVEMFFVGLAILGILFCVVLYIVDSRNSFVLQRPEIVTLPSLPDSEFLRRLSPDGEPDACSVESEDVGEALDGFWRNVSSENQPPQQSAGEPYNVIHKTHTNSEVVSQSFTKVLPERMGFRAAQSVVSFSSSKDDLPTTPLESSVQLPLMHQSSSPTQIPLKEPLVESLNASTVESESDVYCDSPTWAVPRSPYLQDPPLISEAQNIAMFSSTELESGIPLDHSHEKLSTNGESSSLRDRSEPLKWSPLNVNPEPIPLQSCTTSYGYSPTLPPVDAHVLEPFSILSTGSNSSEQPSYRVSGHIPSVGGEPKLPKRSFFLTHLDTKIKGATDPASHTDLLLDSDKDTSIRGLNAGSFNNNKSMPPPSANSRISPLSSKSSFQVSPFLMRYQSFQASSNIGMPTVGLLRVSRSNSSTNINGIEIIDERRTSQDDTESLVLSVE
ncbi:hypothetical protein BASA60_004222 [Batrachochytrium salamandrivorans]|nr:hypothetical protein BASA60_004222 [Batrachochytrium salamandrivorans]